MKTRRLFLACVWFTLTPFLSLQAEELRAVHEWGTFTSLQNEKGESLGSLNIDDEPVPSFVHTLGGIPVHPLTELPAAFSKGIPLSHPDVTMRLETPVLYLYLPEAMKEISIDVEVEFHGGWLTQFYPKADAFAPNHGKSSRLPFSTKSRLTWRGVKASASDDSLPHTESKVWLAPRAVAARTLTVNGETEKYLFYRGVGNLPAPIQTKRSADGNTLTLAPTSPEAEGVQKLWLVDIRPDGSAAWRAGNANTTSFPGTFTPAEYLSDGVAQFRSALHKALVEDGLFDDEADAMLNTWAESYFRTGGTRLFFIVPKSWTEKVLPLKVTLQADALPLPISRVMVGRIELITPEQRRLINIVRNGPAPQSLDSIQKAVIPNSSHKVVENWVALTRGTISLKEAGFTPSMVHHAYLDLGRFRDAILLHEAKHSPTPALNDFLHVFKIQEAP